MSLPTPRHGFRAQTLRALLAVADEPVRTMVERSLRAAESPQFSIATCRDITAALQLPLGDFDLLFFAWEHDTDLDAASRARKNAPALAMVALTSDLSNDPAQRISSIGGQDVLDTRALQEELIVRVARDSIERRRLVDEARKGHDLAQSAEHELKRFVDNSSDGMTVVDAEGTVLHVNAVASNLFGRPSGELLDQPFPFPTEATEVTIDNDHSSILVELRVTPITWYGTAARLIALRDVTTRRRSEELKGRLVAADRLASIGQLAAGVAHEVNNPATFVIANTDSLTERLVQVQQAVVDIQTTIAGFPPELRDNIQSTLEHYDVHSTLLDFESILRENKVGLDRITEIVSALRSFARTDSREVSMVDMNEVITDAATIVQNEIRPRAHFLKHLEELPMIAAHRGQLAQVLVNLLVNAAHAVPDGKPQEHTVTVTSRHVGNSVVITVHDTGIGIEKDAQTRIFEPFFTTKSAGEGTGLGLSLSLEIVEDHRGSITVDSTVGEGTQVTVTLPVQTGKPARRSLPRAVLELPRERGARVLVVDDEIMILRAFRRLLAKSHEVQTADGGEAAKEILRRDANFDVIFCDLMMPDTDGAELYQWLEKRIPHLVDRIVFVSGGAFTPRMKEFAGSVDNQLLEKPVGAAQLRKTIQRMLGTVDDRP